MSKRRPTKDDRVMILYVNDQQADMGFDVGQVHTIEYDDNIDFPYLYLIGGSWFAESCVELVEDEPDSKPIRKDYMLSLLYTLTWLINTGTVESMIIEKLKEELNNDM